MSSPADIAERHSRMLCEFAELSFELAKDLQRRALAAEDDETAGKLAGNFHQVGRALRQSLALHARLQREQAEVGQAPDARAAEALEIRRISRKTQVGKAAEPEVWDEYEDPEDAEFVVCLLPDFVDQIAEDDDFLEAPVETLIARIHQRLSEAFSMEEPAPADHTPPEPGAAAPAVQSSA